jgi:hypothetical protein
MNGNSNSNAAMNGNSNNNNAGGNGSQIWMPQSWFDLVVMSPMDPRGLIQSATFESSGGGQTAGTFTRSSTWLHNSTWVNPPLIASQAGANVTCPNAQDFASVEAANTWNGLHLMTAQNNQLPLSVQKIMFLKAGTAFVNNIFLDWTPAVTSTDVQLSFRDNSTTSGNFQNSASATVPVFAFSGATFGSTARMLQVTLLKTGRFQMALRIIDNSGNYSMYEMDWIVL